MDNKYLQCFAVMIYVLAASVGAFAGGLWATLGISLAMILFLGTASVEKKIYWPDRNSALLVIATLVIFAAEIPLSSRIDISLHVWTQLVSIFVPLLVLTSPHLQKLTYTPRLISLTAAAMGIGAVALGLELNSGGFLLHLFKKPDAGLTQYNRGIAHLVILAFPFCAALWCEGRKEAALALAALLLFPAALTESHTAKLALIIGALCAMAAFYRPVWVRNSLAIFSIVLIGLPFYAQKIFSTCYDSVENLHVSWRHRMEIWDYLSYRIAERPIFGWGLGTTHTLDFLHPHGELYQSATTNAPHAHNFITELWVETGIVGLGLGIVFLLLTLNAAYNLHPSLRSFALGGWMTAVIVSLFGFDFWTDSLWSTFAISAFAFGMLQQQTKSKPDLVRA